MTAPAVLLRRLHARFMPVAMPAAIVAITLGLVLLIARSEGYTHFIVGLVALTTIVGVGLNLLYGLTGLVSLGQVGFYAIGAYTSAILTLNGVSFWLALPLAGVVAGAVGSLLALPAVRLAGPFLAMVTIAFAFIVEHVAIEWRGLTGGQNGLMGFPMPEIAGHAFAERELALVAVLGAGLALYGFHRMSASGWGLAMKGIRDAEVAATSLGYRPVVIKALAFAIAAALAGVAGAVLTPLIMFLAPSNFPFSQSILFLFAVIMGGAGSVLGPFAGAVVTVLLPEFLSGLAEFRLLFFGGLMLVVLWLAPRGIVGTLARLIPAAPRPVVPLPVAEVEAWLAAGRSAHGLVVEGLGISFGGVRAADRVSFTAAPGRVTSIIGPNGAGKTTVLNMVGGFYRPDRGTIRVGAVDLAGRPAHHAARHGVARTYQTTRLFEDMTVIANVVAGYRRGRLGTPFGAAESAPVRALAAGLLRFCGYRGDPDRRAGDLPHVDRRLVEVARALAMRPDVLLLDEPAAGLMRADKQSLAGLIRRLADGGIAVVLVEHDMEMVMGISDTILALDAGAPIASGSPAEVRADPRVVAAYLGEGNFRAPGRAAAFEAVRDAVLATVKLTAGYGAAPVLHAVSLEVRPGEMVALLGANGAGKSTLLGALSGLLRPVSGDILLDDEPIGERSAHQIVDRGLILVPEGRQLFPELTVVDNIRLGAYARKDPVAPAEIEAVLDRFPRLRERLGSRAGLLSGGEQQMVAIARGLMARPKVLLLDEPSLGLAPAMVEELYTILAGLRDEGVTILLVDQMATLALAVADRAYVLEQGRVVAEGPAKALLADERLVAAYLGGGTSGDEDGEGAKRAAHV